MKLASAIAPAIFLAIGLMAVVASVATAAEDEGSRDEKIFSFLNLIRIPNDVCAGKSKNGTCYLADECKERGGEASGTCGGEYGVCCVIELSCGGTSKDNNTFITQKSKSTFALAERACEYKICPQAPTVTRIRFDLQTFVLADPGLQTAKAAGSGVAVVGPAIGQCLSDTFALSGSPEICGTNTGEHMIVDSDGMNCVSAMFTIGASTTVSRSWTILATQYRAGEEESSMAGPSGCLQYFTASSGVIKSFNFPTAFSSAITADATHLVNQKYDICIRRASGMCHICYTPIIAGTAGVIDQGTYGIGLADGTTSTASATSVDSNCKEDFLLIPNGGLSTLSSKINGKPDSTNQQKYCGRFLGTNAAGTADVTICSQSVPFTVHVNFDGKEVMGGTNAAMGEDDFPSGSIGFALVYAQGKTC